jgi:hypothetical protein
MSESRISSLRKWNPAEIRRLRVDGRVFGFAFIFSLLQGSIPKYLFIWCVHIAILYNQAHTALSNWAERLSFLKGASIHGKQKDVGVGRRGKCRACLDDGIAAWP